LALGAFALPALRRPPAQAEAADVATPEPAPLRSAGPAVPAPPPPPVATAPAAAPAPTPAAPAAVAEAPPARSAFDRPLVAPRLPSATGPYALSLRIDREVEARMAAAQLPASPLAGDAEFLRRVYLDLVGKVPTRDRAAEFLLDENPLKRARLIDELLASPDYGRHFAQRWADALVKRDFDNNRGLATGPFVGWLAERFNANKGWDEVVRELVTAGGQEQESPATFLVLANMDNRQPSPAKLTGAVGNLFMGIQIQCAECHKHPFHEKWGVSDFWGMAAFFGHTRAQRPAPVKGKKATGPARITEVEQVRPTKNKKGKQVEAAVRPGLVINVPDPNDPRKVIRTARGKFFESGETPPPGQAPYRPRLAAWLTSPKNRYFTPAAVNRLWAHFFARGLVHPVEEMGGENKPTHPELLRELSAAFVRSKYDLKDLIRAVCNSRAYQRTSRPLPNNAADDRLYSHMPVKILGAREVLASLTIATGREVKAPRPAPVGRRGMRDAGDPMVRYLDTRDYDDDATEFSYGIPQMLRLMNTPLTAASAEKARQLARRHAGNHAAAIDDLYLTALARPPSPAEARRMLSYVGKQEDAAKGYAGVFWALLNCAEFVSNH
jgi:hypothetical protein